MTDADKRRDLLLYQLLTPWAAHTVHNILFHFDLAKSSKWTWILTVLSCAAEMREGLC